MPSVHKLMNPQEESQHGHVESTSTRRTWCIISKGGEDGGDRLRITITDRVRYLLPTLWLQDRWDLIHLIRPRTRPSNTRNKNRRKRRSRCNFQGCIDFQGWNHFDGILHYFFTETVNNTQYRELPTKEVKIKRRYYKSISVCKGVMIWREAPHRGLRQSHTILPLVTWHRSLVAIEVARAWAHKMLTHLSYSKSRRLLARSVH